MGIHVLAQQVLHKPSIEDCSLNELESLVNRYPYFAPARFLLAQKLQKEGNKEADTARSTAILYYPYPLAFFEFIQPERFEVDIDSLKNKEKDEKGEVESEEPEKEEKEEFVLIPDIEEESEEEEEEEPQRESKDSEVKIPSIKQEEVKETDPLFMPYHTVDYFASQGIKLGREETANDRFGKQLLSFTEWLKTLKKGPVSSSEATSQQAETNPSETINTTEVYTEAMAEVWIKQGNREKAAEVYNKLSLLNPSKKAYFAAKIEHLSKT